MKKILIEINAFTPDEVVEALDEIKQAILLGNDGYKSSKGLYEFQCEGDYTN